MTDCVCPGRVRPETPGRPGESPAPRGPFRGAGGRPALSRTSSRTRFGSRGCGNLSGSKGTRDHARGIARHLRQRGYCVSGSASFVVEGNGPLKPGELERAREWAALPAAKVTETLAGDARR